MRSNHLMLRQSSGLLGALALGLLLASGPVFAARAPPPESRWAVVPLVVVGGEGKEAKQFQSAFESEVGKSGLDRANPKLVTSFLSQEPSCIRKDECLGKLAKAVNSERVLLVTISPFAKDVVLTMKIVGSNGQVINESASTVSRSANETVLAASRDSFQAMLSDLQTEPAPLTPIESKNPNTTQKQPTGTGTGTTAQQQTGTGTTAQQSGTQKPPTTSGTGTGTAQSTGTGTSQQGTASLTPKPPATQPNVVPPAALPSAPAPETNATWKTPVGLGVAGLGVVGLGLGTYFLIQSNGTWAKTDPLYANEKLPTAADLSPITKQANSQRTLSIVSYAAGAVALGVGGVLFLTDDRSEKKPSGARVSARLAVTPNSGTLVVTFP